MRIKSPTAGSTVLKMMTRFLLLPIPSEVPSKDPVPSVGLVAVGLAPLRVGLSVTRISVGVPDPGPDPDPGLIVPPGGGELPGNDGGGGVSVGTPPGVDSVGEGFGGLSVGGLTDTNGRVVTVTVPGGGLGIRGESGRGPGGRNVSTGAGGTCGFAHGGVGRHPQSLSLP